MDAIRIENYKCIGDYEIRLPQLTVLTGYNSSGKSSIIDVLRILRWAAELMGDNGPAFQKQHGMKFIDVRDPEDLIRRGEDHVRISGRFGEIDMKASPSQGQAVTAVDFDKDRMPGWLISDDFAYLSAERTGPRWESPLPEGEVRYCGPHGEYAAKRLFDISVTFPKIDLARRSPGTKGDNFQIQVDSWMSYIFGDVSFKSSPLKDYQGRIMVRQPMGTFGAPAVGFGYVYALPIVIDGLTIPYGSMLMVENPEAHLHPKAQSNIGYFLGVIAAAGVKVVVETHSEHVVNGMRRAALSGLGLEPNEMLIYFFGEKMQGFNPVPITMDDEGELSDFPVDFFDQVRQDMKEMWRLVAQKASLKDDGEEDGERSKETSDR